MTFTDKLNRAVRSSQSLLCVGLDPVKERIPAPLREQYSDDAELIFEFCRRVIEATKTSVCAYKPNVAFFESLGSRGWHALEKVMDCIPSNRVVIADAKRGDIGNTAFQYRKAYFEHLQADAVTLNPLMGLETLDSFLDAPERAVFVLAMTSNKGASEFLQRRFEGRLSLGEYLAEELNKLQPASQTHLGMVVGATQVSDLKPLLKVHPDAHLLIPGLGAQGGSAEEMINLVQDHRGIPVFNSSRSIIYAGGDEVNWTARVAEQTAVFNDMLNPLLQNYV
jgi:orotidine-5'-phosphate decarboxylase